MNHLITTPAVTGAEANQQSIVDSQSKFNTPLRIDQSLVNRHSILSPTEWISMGLEYLQDLNRKANVNIDSVNPLECHRLQANRHGLEHMVIVLYHHPDGRSFSALVSKKENLFLKDLMDADGDFVETSEFKRSKGESRKVISQLRQLGFVIATLPGVKDERDGAWALLGSVDFLPRKGELSAVPPATQCIPRITKAATIHQLMKSAKRYKQDRKEQRLVKDLMNSGESGDE